MCALFSFEIESPSVAQGVLQLPILLPHTLFMVFADVWHSTWLHRWLIGWWLLYTPTTVSLGIFTLLRLLVGRPGGWLEMWLSW